jgi:hypothetical protein
MLILTPWSVFGPLGGVLTGGGTTDFMPKDLLFIFEKDEGA